MDIPDHRAIHRRRVTTRLEDANGGTKGDLPPRNRPVSCGPLGKLDEPLVVRIIRRDMRPSLEKLKQLLKAE